MKRAIDTNVLVYAHLPSHAEHTRVAAYLREQLQDPNVVVVVTPLVLHEFIHVVTDARRFDPPVTMAEALATARLYMGRANVDVVPVGEDALVAALGLLERHGLGRKRIADALLAGALIAADVTEIVTCNPGDFAPFEGLHVIDPRVA